jgi:hypothetical protein
MLEHLCYIVCVAQELALTAAMLRHAPTSVAVNQHRRHVDRLLLLRDAASPCGVTPRPSP